MLQEFEKIFSINLCHSSVSISVICTSTQEKRFGAFHFGIFDPLFLSAVAFVDSRLQPARPPSIPSLSGVQPGSAILSSARRLSEVASHQGAVRRATRIRDAPRQQRGWVLTQPLCRGRGTIPGPRQRQKVGVPNHWTPRTGRMAGYILAD